jgi:hypothetical protein
MVTEKTISNGGEFCSSDCYGESAINFLKLKDHFLCPGAIRFKKIEKIIQSS